MTWMPDWLASVWPVVAGAGVFAAAACAAGHAILHRRDSRAALLWVGLIWLLPLLGSILYALLGINRVRRRARTLRAHLRRVHTTPRLAPVAAQSSARFLAPGDRHLADLVRIVDHVAIRPLLPGNAVTPLRGGDEAFPAMFEAVDAARHTLNLATYIFDRDDLGRRLIEHLGAAVRRGVQVRVLLDDAGARYSFPSVVRPLRRAGVQVALFHRRFGLAFNLRNHRKILIADGRTGFTGGMNLRAGAWLSRRPRRPFHDLHFRIEGPVVAELQEVFAEDWTWTTGESLGGEEHFPALEEVGPVLARALADGPDENRDKMRWTLLGALNVARRSVRILTPYFLPDAALVSALSVAARRGVEVDIVLPGHSNLPFVQWAMQAMLWQVLDGGCRVWLTPPPFDHSKLMVIDGAWTHFGSGNWDPRSLRLNFELNVEAYDPGLAAEAEAIVSGRIETARRVTLAELEARPLPVRLRDGVARLFEPVL